MPKAYRLGTSRRAVNALIAPLAKLGLAGRHTYVLAVRGRKTGRRYETPVRLIENGERWLVAPYGEVAWVRNARAAGEIVLMRGRRAEILRIEQAAPGASSTGATAIRQGRSGRASFLRRHSGILHRRVRS
jgi:F420H(2)-dependent quinone reductase